MSCGAGLYHSLLIAAQYTPYTQQLHGLSRSGLGARSAATKAPSGGAEAGRLAGALGFSSTPARLSFLPPFAHPSSPGRAAAPRKPPFKLNLKRCNLTCIVCLLELPELLSPGRCKQNCIQNWAQQIKNWAQNWMQNWVQQIKSCMQICIQNWAQIWMQRETHKPSLRKK